MPAGGRDGAGQGIALATAQRRWGSRFFWLLRQKNGGAPSSLEALHHARHPRKARVINSPPARNGRPPRTPRTVRSATQNEGCREPARRPSGAAWRNAPSSGWRRAAPAGARPKEPLFGGGTERDRQPLSASLPRTGRRSAAGQCRVRRRSARRRCRRAASHRRPTGCCCPS